MLPSPPSSPKKNPQKNKNTTTTTKNTQKICIPHRHAEIPWNIILRHCSCCSVAMNVKDFCLRKQLVRAAMRPPSLRRKKNWGICWTSIEVLGRRGEKDDVVYAVVCLNSRWGYLSCMTITGYKLRVGDTPPYSAGPALGLFHNGGHKQHMILLRPQKYGK